VSFGGKKIEKKIIDLSSYVILSKEEKRDRHLHFLERRIRRSSTISVGRMALQLTLSCDLDKTESGPTLIHSTGVQHYKIPPEVVGKIEQFV
jgi:hypothetical protein